jgi:uncharacterized repeat protein (TIGR01451 family)
VPPATQSAHPAAAADANGPRAGAAASAAAATPSAMVPLGPQSPSISLEKVGPASVICGKTLAYEIVARNTGKVTVANVRVEEELPAGTRFLSAEPRPDARGDQPVWNLGTLEPGAERRIKIEVQPVGEGDLTSRATATFSVSSGMQTRVTRPRLVLTIAGPEAGQMGDQIVFQIQVANTGTGPATGVVLHDHLPAGLWHEQGSQIDAEIGTLAAGESRSVTLQTTAVRPGPQINEASATADGSLQVATRASVTITEAFLTLRQTGPKRRYINREAEYTLEVANPGTAPANNARVIDVLPPGLEFVSASEGASHNAAARTVTWRLNTLAPGQKRTISVKVVAKAAGDLVNQAMAQADRGLEAKAAAAVKVEGAPALLLEVVDLDDPIEVGAETTYEIRVLNQGTSPSNTVKIAATVPAGMVPREASGPSAFHIEGQQVTFESLPKLAPRTDVVFRVRVAAQQAGDMRFKVQLMADHLSRPLCEEESTQVYSD